MITFWIYGIWQTFLAMALSWGGSDSEQFPSFGSGNFGLMGCQMRKFGFQEISGIPLILCYYQKVNTVCSKNKCTIFYGKKTFLSLVKAWWILQTGNKIENLIYALFTKKITEHDFGYFWVWPLYCEQFFFNPYPPPLWIYEPMRDDASVIYILIWLIV